MFWQRASLFVSLIKSHKQMTGKGLEIKPTHFASSLALIEAWNSPILARQEAG